MVIERGLARECDLAVGDPIDVGRRERQRVVGIAVSPDMRDEESPGRVPFLDRLGAPLNSTFRPHEAFSTQVLDATVRALARERAQAVVVTGDIVDSAQANELDQALAVLEGGVVSPDSGGAGYDGVQAPSSPDPFFFRPDHDAPRHTGALAAAQEPFRAAGLGVPWYPAIGNHDILVQGEVPPTGEITEVATGGRLVTNVDPALLRRRRRRRRRSCLRCWPTSRSRRGCSRCARRTAAPCSRRGWSTTAAAGSRASGASSRT